MPTKLLRNATDTFVLESQPSKNFGTAARLHVRNETSNRRRALLFFNLPFPKGVRIVSAKLQMRNAQDISGAINLTVNRAAAKWSANGVRWNNFPGGAGTVGSVNKTSPNAGTLWEADVTSLMQDVANGAAWYGFILVTTTSAKEAIFHSAQSPTGAYRPTLVIVWSEAPHQPSSLSPSGNRAVPTQKPSLSYDFSDPNGEGDLAYSRFEIAVGSDGSGLEYDSGMIATDLPQLDLSSTAYAGIPSDGTTRYWRVQAQDEDGNLSPWSAWAAFKYLVKGVATITAPSSNFSDGSPVVSWSFTGGTQKSYQVWIALASAPDSWLWTSGKITDTITAINIPFGIIKNPALTYRFGVKVWDNQARQAVPGYPVYSEAFTDRTYAPGATADVTSLASSPDLVKPNIILTWSRSSAPDTFQILRSKNGGTTWEYLDEVTAAAALVSGTNYSWTDTGVAWYKTMKYKVISIVGSVGGAGATVNAKATKLAPFLMRPDGSDLVCFMNPDRSRQKMDINAVHQTMNGKQVLVTQALGKYAGHVSGVFYDDFPRGYSAEDMKDSFNSMRDDTGMPLKLSYVDQSLTIVAYNMTIDSFADSTGIFYRAEFDWIQI